MKAILKISVKIVLTLAVTLALTGLTSQNSQAADGGGSSGGGSNAGAFGVNVAAGLPFLTQVGINYFPTSMFSVSLGYNTVHLEVDEGEDGAEAKVELDLKMPELILNWHPFSGAFFVGGGIGKETLDVKGTEESTGETIDIEVEANTTIAKVGWMWSVANKGFWFGIDVSYIKPSNAKTTITTDLPTSNDTYQDAKDDADDFGDSSYANITFARFGWLF